MKKDFASKLYLKSQLTIAERQAEALKKLQAAGKWTCGEPGKTNDYKRAEHGNTVLNEWREQRRQQQEAA